jgi:hypothetical protein
MLREIYVELRRRKEQQAEENCIMRSFIIFLLFTKYYIVLFTKCFGGPCCLHSEDGDTMVL